MSALTLVWLAALVQVVGALTWMLWLIGLRVWRQRAEARLASDHQAVLGVLVEILREVPNAPERLRPYLGRPRVLAEAVLEFLALIRGSGQEVVLDELRLLGVHQVLRAGLSLRSKSGGLAIIDALAAFGGSEADQALNLALKDRDPDVRIAALKGLAGCGAAISIRTVLAHAAKDARKPSRLLVEVVRSVASAKPDEAIQALADGDLDPLCRTLLLDALGASGAYEALPVLIASAADPDPELRTAAVRGLGRMMHPAGEAAIGVALADGNWQVRAAGAESAGHAGLSRLADGLGRLLDDPEWWVRFRAGEALSRLGVSGLERLRAAAVSDRPVAQLTATLALAESGL